MAKLLRVDRNGTKYWLETKCPKCGGQGSIDAYYYNQAGVCFLCGGSGYHETTWKEYTPEYAEKLAERRRKKARAKAPEVNAKLFKQLGMSEDGKAWIVLGNTYEIKDALKEAGARWNDMMGWHFDHEDNGYNTAQLSIEDIAEKDENTWAWDLYEQYFVIKTVKELKDANAPKTDSEYIGEIGDKVELELTFKDYFTFETHYSYYGELNFIYKFADADGNTIVWKTSKALELEQGETYKVKGTIKEHNEYKGDKQTVLTRCKVAA
jgi:hypothetical protein